MNREILFRAKHVHAFSKNEHLDGEWVEGYLCDENYINTGEAERLIDSNTICQYIRKDRDGKRIWENDIVRGRMHGTYGYRTYVGVVQYCIDGFGVNIAPKSEFGDYKKIQINVKLSEIFSIIRNYWRQMSNGEDI